MRRLTDASCVIVRMLMCTRKLDILFPLSLLSICHSKYWSSSIYHSKKKCILGFATLKNGCFIIWHL